MNAMKVNIRVLALACGTATSFFLFPAGAEATMYGNVQEIRDSMSQVLWVMAIAVAGFSGLLAWISRIGSADEIMIPLNSVVVPPIKQESNIVQGIINP